MHAIRSLVQFVSASRRKIGVLLLVATQLSRAPWSVRLLLIGALLYGLMPLDLIPDLIPGLGVADDITVMGVLLVMAWRKFWQNIDQQQAQTYSTGTSEPREQPHTGEATVRDAGTGAATRTYVRRRPSTAG